MMQKTCMSQRICLFKNSVCRALHKIAEMLLGSVFFVCSASADWGLLAGLQAVPGASRAGPDTLWVPWFLGAGGWYCLWVWAQALLESTLPHKALHECGRGGVKAQH